MFQYTQWTSSANCTAGNDSSPPTVNTIANEEDLVSLEGDTIFHKIIRRELPADIVFEDEHVMAFKDINAAAPHHILIIPKTVSIESLRSAKDDDAQLLGRMLLCARNIAADIGLNDSGYRIVLNSGEAACQTVFHIHMHLLGGRDFTWPPG